MKPKPFEIIVEFTPQSTNTGITYEAHKKGSLIRCKDCKFYEVAELNNDGTPDKRCKPSICADGWYEYAVEREPNWFCADAKPRNSE